MRLFLAIDVPEDLKNDLHEFQSTWLVPELRELSPRLVARDNLHVTLVFLGQIHESQLEALNNSVNEVVCESSRFSLQIKGCHWAPHNKKDVSMAWVSFEASERFASLHKKLCNVLQSSPNLKVTLESGRDQTPHITLARFDALARSQLSQMPEWVDASGKPQWEVNSVVLYESKTLPTGPVYTALASFPLSGRSES